MVKLFSPKSVFNLIAAHKPENLFKKDYKQIELQNIHSSHPAPIIQIIGVFPSEYVTFFGDISSDFQILLLVIFSYKSSFHMFTQQQKLVCSNSAQLISKIDNISLLDKL